MLKSTKSVKRKKNKINLQIFQTYQSAILNSIGSKQYRSLVAIVSGKKVDILKGGRLSCAYYVSSILYLFKQLKGVHATVDSTVRDLMRSGWNKVEKPVLGSVIVWKADREFGKDMHKHIGFYIGGGKAVSNSSKLRYPTKHSWNYGGKRKVEIVLWNRKLSQS